MILLMQRVLLLIIEHRRAVARLTSIKPLIFLDALIFHFCNAPINILQRQLIYDMSVKHIYHSAWAEPWNSISEHSHCVIINSFLLPLLHCSVPPLPSRQRHLYECRVVRTWTHHTFKPIKVVVRKINRQKLLLLNTGSISTSGLLCEVFADFSHGQAPVLRLVSELHCPNLANQLPYLARTLFGAIGRGLRMELSGLKCRTGSRRTWALYVLYIQRLVHFDM